MPTIKSVTGSVNSITDLIAALSPLFAAGKYGIEAIVAMVRAAHPTMTNEQLNADVLPAIQQHLAETQALLKERADVLAEIAARV